MPTYKLNVGMSFFQKFQIGGAELMNVLID